MNLSHQYSTVQYMKDMKDRKDPLTKEFEWYLLLTTNYAVNALTWPTVLLHYYY